MRRLTALRSFSSAVGVFCFLVLTEAWSASSSMMRAGISPSSARISARSSTSRLSTVLFFLTTAIRTSLRNRLTGS